MFSRFIDRARAGEPIVIDGTGEQSRQFTHTRDIARAFRLAAESDLTGVVMNAVSPERVTIRALAEAANARVAHLDPLGGVPGRETYAELLRLFANANKARVSHRF